MSIKEQMDGCTRRQCLRKLAMAVAALASTPCLMGEVPQMRMALSLDLLAGINATDSRAAYKVWAEQVISRFGLKHFEMLPEVFYSSTRLLPMLRARQVECLGLSAQEIYKVQNELDMDTAMLEDYSADGLEYVVLVQNTSPFHHLEELKNRRMIIHRHRDTVLLPLWLEVQMNTGKQGACEEFFESLSYRDKVNEAILPLFFGKTDAIGITRRAFQTAAELNPQLGRQLRVLLVSPKLVLDALMVRKGCDPLLKQQLIQAITGLSSIPAGKQLLSLYESKGFVIRPGSVFAGTFELIKRHDKMGH